MPGRRTLTLELDVVDQDSIIGRLSDATGRSTEFIGWLGLASAIEALATDEPATTHRTG